MDHSSESNDVNSEIDAPHHQRSEDCNELYNLRGFSVRRDPNNDDDGDDDRNLPDPAEPAAQGENIKSLLADKMGSLQKNMLAHLELLRVIEQNEQEIQELNKQLAECNIHQDQAIKQQPTTSSQYLKAPGRHLQQSRAIMKILNSIETTEEEPTTSSSVQHIKQKELNEAEKLSQELEVHVDDNERYIDQATEQQTSSSHQSLHSRHFGSIGFSKESLATIDYDSQEILVANQNVICVFSESETPESERQLRWKVAISKPKVVRRIVFDSDEATEEPTTSSSVQHIKQKELNEAEKLSQELDLLVDDNEEYVDQAKKQQTSSSLSSSSSHQSLHSSHFGSIGFSNESLATIDYDSDEIRVANQNVICVFSESDVESGIEPVIVKMPMKLDSPESEHQLLCNVVISMRNFVRRFGLREGNEDFLHENEPNEDFLHENEPNEDLYHENENEHNEDFWNLNVHNEDFWNLNVPNEDFWNLNEPNESLAVLKPTDEAFMILCEHYCEAENSGNDTSIEQESGSYTLDELKALAIGGLSDKNTSEESDNANVELEKALAENAGLETLVTLLKNTTVSFGEDNNATISVDNILREPSNKNHLYQLLELIFGKNPIGRIKLKHHIRFPKPKCAPSKPKKIVFLIQRYNYSDMNIEDTIIKVKRLRKTRKINKSQETESKNSTE